MKRTGIEILARSESERKLRERESKSESDMAEKKENENKKKYQQQHKNHDTRNSRKMYGLDRQRRTTGVDKLNWQDCEQQNMLTEKYDSTEVSGWKQPNEWRRKKQKKNVKNIHRKKASSRREIKKKDEIENYTNNLCKRKREWKCGLNDMRHVLLIFTASAYLIERDIEKRNPSAHMS